MLPHTLDSEKSCRSVGDGRYICSGRGFWLTSPNVSSDKEVGHIGLEAGILDRLRGGTTPLAS